MPRAYFRAGL